MLHTVKDHRKRNKEVGLRFFSLALREDSEDAAFFSYPLFLLCYVAPLRPPLLREECPAVTAIIIWDHEGLVHGCYVDRMQLTTGIVFVSIRGIGGFVQD